MEAHEQSSHVLSLLVHFFRMPSATNRSCFIHRLPIDLLVDCVFPRLHVEDIISLRLVNKAFHLVTHMPVIWERILMCMDQPVPHRFPPSKDYLYRPDDFAFEQLVVQAITAHRNWCRRKPVVYRTLTAETLLKVLDMKLTPGGNFLVTSAKDEYRYILTLYSLNHIRGPVPLARVNTYGRAYNLQVKYLPYMHKPGLLIAYTRRRLRNAAIYDPRVKINRKRNPLVYDSVCLHMSQDMIDFACTPDAKPPSNMGPPFKVILEDQLTSDDEVRDISLSFMEDSSYLIEIKERAVDITRLDDGKSKKLLFEGLYGAKDYIIQSARILPLEKRILVIRTVFDSPYKDEDKIPPIFMEIYNLAPSLLSGPEMPDQHEVIRPSKWGREFGLHHRSIVASIISDYDMPDSLINGIDHPPPPLSIFFVTANPDNVIHTAMFPLPASENTPSGEPTVRFVYRIDVSLTLARGKYVDHKVVVFPGAFRSMAIRLDHETFRVHPRHPEMGEELDVDELRYPIEKQLGPSLLSQPDHYIVNSVPSNFRPTLMTIERLSHPQRLPAGYPASLLKFPTYKRVTRKGYKPSLKPNRLGLEHFRHTELVKTVNTEGGVIGFSWDEISAKACIVGTDEKVIHIMEYSRQFTAKERLKRWKRNQAMLGLPIA